MTHPNDIVAQIDLFSPIPAIAAQGYFPKSIRSGGA